MWTTVFIGILFATIVYSSTIRHEIPRRFEKSLDNDKVVKNALEIPNIITDDSDEDISSSDSDEDDEDYDGPRPEGGGAYFADDNGQLIYAQFNGENPAMASKSSDKKKIRFYLYTQGSEVQQLLLDDLDSITKSTYNPKHLTKILIHGFSNSYKSEFVQHLKDTYLQFFNYNVIVVDWSRLSGAPWYYSASKNTMRTGEYTAELINILVNKFKTPLSNFHIIGHSLGAHTGGIVSKHLAVPGKLPRITGLDPALPLYSSAANKWLLTTDDAEFVDVIHTSGGNLGFMDPMGHGDFYPNGGVAPQPGCGFDLTASCSHSRSWEYFGETIANEVAFPTKECDDLKQAKKGKCNSDRDITPNMGEKAYKDEEHETGLYYTKTLKKKPYAINSE